MKQALLVEQIGRRILLVRGHRVMLDSDLAELYGVETKVLNQAVKRNMERFPEGFVFQLNLEEYESQFKVVFEAIRELMAPPHSPRRRIGSHT